MFGVEGVDGVQALVLGLVSVNGVALQLGPGGRIVVDPGLVGGSVTRHQLVTLSPGSQGIRWTMPEGFVFDGLDVGGIAVVNRTLANVEAALKVAELPVGAVLKMEFSAENGSQAKLDAPPHAAAGGLHRASGPVPGGPGTDGGGPDHRLQRPGPHRWRAESRRADSNR